MCAKPHRLRACRSLSRNFPLQSSPVPRLLSFLGISLLALTACTLTPPRANPPPRVPLPDTALTSSPSSPSSSLRAETGETGELPPTTEERTSTGAIAERLLPSGLLEFGSPDAPLTLLVVTEFHCRYCQQFAMELLPRLFVEDVERGTLKINIAILPLRKYERSRAAALQLLCAARSGRGYALHQAFFANPLPATETLPLKELGIPPEEFTACLGDPETERLMQEQEAWLKSLGVTLVPTFFLNGEKFVGLPYYADLRGRIDAAKEKL